MSVGEGGGDLVTNLVLHLLLQGSAEGVKRVATRDNVVVGEQSEPLQSVEDAILLVGILELGLGANGRDKVPKQG